MMQTGVPKEIMKMVEEDTQKELEEEEQGVQESEDESDMKWDIFREEEYIYEVVDSPTPSPVPEGERWVEGL